MDCKMRKLCRNFCMYEIYENMVFMIVFREEMLLNLMNANKLKVYFSDRNYNDKYLCQTDILSITCCIKCCINLFTLHL